MKNNILDIIVCVIFAAIPALILLWVSGSIIWTIILFITLFLINITDFHNDKERDKTQY